MNYEDAIHVCHRDNNKKRKFLLVNALQGKHVPAKPSQVIGMFDALADKVIQTSPDPATTLVIGFAETATAIATHVAHRIGCDYICTTRFKFGQQLTFTEDHSHAVTQYIDATVDYQRYYHIIFVDDEITTGNTIRHLAKAIHFTGKKTVACIVDCTNGNLTGFDVVSLIKRTPDYSCGHISEGIYEHTGTWSIPLPVSYQVPICVTPFQLSHPSEYEQVDFDFSDLVGKKVDVIGTEEFMYPAIDLAYRMEQAGVNTTTHSTTRSPISTGKESILKSRATILSTYDPDREVYLYNLEHCDAIVVVTPSYYLKSLLGLLKFYTDRIILLRTQFSRKETMLNENVI